MQRRHNPAQLLTIVRDVGAYKTYEPRALGPEIRAQFLNDETLGRLRPMAQSYVPRVLTLLECYLAVTGQILHTLTDLGEPRFASIARCFLGALYSPKFFKASRTRRYEYACSWRAMLIALHPLLPANSIPERVRFKVSPSLLKYAAAFERQRLDPDAVWLWSGWRTENLNGEVRWLALYRLAKALGRDFTQEYYAIADVFFSNGRGQHVEHIELFADFIAAYPGVSRSNLLSTAFCQDLLHEFSSYFIQKQIKENRPDRVSLMWRGLVTRFFRDHLIPAGLIAEDVEIPILPKLDIVSDSCHLGVDDDGAVRIEKLLTHVPIHLTNAQAIDILFNRLERDVVLIATWADAQTETIWEAYLGRQALSKASTCERKGSRHDVRSTRKEHTNKNSLVNEVAYLDARGGYATAPHGNAKKLSKSSLPRVARELGIPIANALLPHMTLLVLEHPQITPSFLEKLEIFDGDGAPLGFILDDSGPVLTSTKMRRKPYLAQQNIILSEKARRVVEQVIALTAAPREYMKRQKIPGATKLFLSTGRAFGNPTPVRRIATCTSHRGRLQTLARELALANGMGRQEAESLADRFSLPALRASKGVLVYVETCSGKKMAEALGQKQFDPHLLRRYLPEVIRAFLQNRYIRIMQTGVIVEAMKDSPLILEAACFSDPAELHAFLTNHSLRLPNKCTADPECVDDLSEAVETDVRDGRVVFNISVATLTVYTSLELAHANNIALSPVLKYWHAIGTHLIRFIEQQRYEEPDHIAMLEKARRAADIKYVTQV